MIIASMATIPGREDICEKAVQSLYRQLDTENTLPPFVITGEVHGRMDDARKFWLPGVCYGLPQYDAEAYIFTCDDDLIYPPDYVQKMIEAIERYERKAIVTLHGGVVSPPITSYYWGGRRPVYHCLQDVEGSHRVHIPGSGVMAYHTDTIRFSMDDFPHQNMADIQAGIKANKEGVPIYVIEHKHNWLTYQETGDVTLHTRFKHQEPDTIQTRLVNETKWKPLTG